MQKVILLLILFYGVFLQAQESNKKEIVDIIVITIAKAHSNLGLDAPFIVDKVDSDNLKLNLHSVTKSIFVQLEESFVFDLNNLNDVFLAPSMESDFKLIVSLKKETLIIKKTTEFKNLFHEEVITEDLKETSDIWFLFTNESDANILEKALLDIKTLLNSNGFR